MTLTVNEKTQSVYLPKPATEYYGNELNYEKIREAKQIAEQVNLDPSVSIFAFQAVQCRKVYRLDGGHRYIRKALKKRGWVEKFTNRTKRFQTGDDGDAPLDTV